MRIDEFELVAYGRYERRVLPLTPGNQLQVLLGRNGAGKTTMLEGTSDLLFGFPERTRQGYRFPSEALRLRAKLSFGDGETIEFVRRKGRKNTLSSPDGTLLPDDALDNALAGIDRGLFETMFALSHERLREGGQALLEARGEIGEALFGAGLGSSALHKTIEALAQRADGIFLPRASKPLLNAALKELEDARREVRSLALRASTRRTAERELEELQVQIETITATLLAARTEHERLRRVDQVIPYVAQRELKLETVATFAAVRRLSDDARERRLLALTTRSQAQRALEDAREKISEIEGKLEALERSPELLDRAEEIAELHSQRGAYIKEGSDLPRVAAERDAALAEAKAALSSIAPHRLLDDVEDLRPSAALRTRINEAKEALTLADDREQTATKTRADTKTALTNAEAARPPEPASVPLERAQAVLVAARKRGDLDDNVRRLGDTASARRREAADALAELASWAGSFDDLSQLRVPSGETVNRFAEEFEALNSEIRSVRAEVDRSDRRLGEIVSLLRDPDTAALPTEEEIVGAREAQACNWQLVRQVWLGGADVAEASEFTEDEALASALEVAVATTDDLVDRSRHQAKDVAERDGLLLEQEREIGTCEASLVATTELIEKHERLELDWRSAWPGLVDVLTPTEMRGWTRDRARVLDLHRLAAAAEAEAVQARSDLQREHAAVRAAAHSIASIDLDGSESLAASITALEAAVERVLAQRETAGALEAQIRGLQAAKTGAEEALASAKTERADAHGRWLEVVAQTGAADITSPAEVEDVVATLELLFRRLDEAAGLTRRVDGMQRGREQFEAAVASLIVDAAPDLKKLPADQATTAVAKQLATDQANRVEGRQLEERLAEQEAIATGASDALRGAETELNLLCELAGTNLEGLEQAEQLSQQRATLEQEIGALETTIAEVGAGRLDKIVAAATAADIDETAARVASVHDEIEALDEQRTDLIRESTRREAELNREAGSSDAAAAEERAQAASAKASRLRDAYIEAKLATVMLRRAIDAYRERNQGPILTKARALFPRLTLGEFSGIGLVGGDEEVALVGKRGAEEVHVRDMSDGERDALYLALRIASLDHHFQTNEPMPLIIDDILIGLDDDRVAAALEALGELAEKTQVILFTHHRRVIELAERTLNSRASIHDLSAGDPEPGEIAQAA